VVVGPVLDAPVVAAFEPDDAEAGLRQLRGDDPSDPADTDDADVCLLVGHLTSLPTTCSRPRWPASSSRSTQSSPPFRPLPRRARAAAASSRADTACR